MTVLHLCESTDPGIGGDRSYPCNLVAQHHDPDGWHCHYHSNAYATAHTRNSAIAAAKERVVSTSAVLRPFFPQHSPFTDRNGMASIAGAAVAALSEWRAAVDALTAVEAEE